MRPKGIAISAWLEENSEVIPWSGCKIWLGQTDKDGYGKIWIKGKTKRTHRVSWELKNGPIPKNKEILHKCDIPSCIEETHLFVGTNTDNQLDKARKNRGVKSQLKLPYGVFMHRDHHRKNPYQARIVLKGTKHYIGCFPSPQEAGEAASQFKKKIIEEGVV
jgi:hypothetical protein